MCVLTMSTAALVATVASIAAATASTVMQNSAQKKMAAINAQETRRQAQKAEMEAAYERQDGIEAARKQKINAILNSANSKTQMAGGNIAMSSGTVINIEDDTRINSELDALTTQKNSERRAQNYVDKSSSLYRDAELTLSKSRVSSRGTSYQLGSSMTSSLSNILGQVERIKNGK